MYLAFFEEAVFDENFAVVLLQSLSPKRTKLLDLGGGMTKFSMMFNFLLFANIFIKHDFCFRI